MVECIEVVFVLRYVINNFLVVLDEFGCGILIFDGYVIVYVVRWVFF